MFRFPVSPSLENKAVGGGCPGSPRLRVWRSYRRCSGQRRALPASQPRETASRLFSAISRERSLRRSHLRVSVSYNPLTRRSDKTVPCEILRETKRGQSRLAVLNVNLCREYF